MAKGIIIKMSKTIEIKALKDHVKSLKEKLVIDYGKNSRNLYCKAYRDCLADIETFLKAQ